jgi:DNA replication protein DnaC
MRPEELRERLKDWWNVPSRYLDCRFENFDSYDHALKSRLDLAKRVAAEKRSALLFGKPGVGKTHIAIAVMSEWISRGARGHFVGALEYTLQVQSAYANPKQIADDLVDDIHFLILDDIGTERANETSRVALMYLIDKAYRDQKRLIVTSNLTPEEIGAFEPRIPSRLAQMGALIEIKAADYRVRIAAQRQKADVAERFPPTVN